MDGDGASLLLKFELEALDLASNVVEVLVLSHPDVVLQQTLHDLLLFVVHLDHSQVYSAGDSLLHIGVQICLQLRFLQT